MAELLARAPVKSSDNKRLCSVLDLWREHGITQSNMSLTALLILATSSLAAQYECVPTFGESVPLRLFWTQQEVRPPVDYHREIPESPVWTWNEGIASAGGQTSKPKRRMIHSDEGFFYFDTRYMVQKVQPFVLELDCSKGAHPCEVRLRADSKIRFSAPLFDQRDPSCQAQSTMQTTKRGVAGLLGRLWKTCADGSKTLSGSGEIKFYSEEPEFSFDFGVDEQMHFGSHTYERNAALELKVECKLAPLE